MGKLGKNSEELNSRERERVFKIYKKLKVFPLGQINLVSVNHASMKSFEIRKL